MSVGVLNTAQTEQVLFAGGWGGSDPAWIPTTPVIQAGGSAIDLPLGTRYLEVKASRRPSKSVNIENIIEEIKVGDWKTLAPNTLLEKDKVYWIALKCSRLQLPKGISARATGKSSIGRLDAMVRLVAEGEDEFDTISVNNDRQAPVSVFVEVVPLTFNLRVSPGCCLSQLRLMCGEDRLCLVPRQALAYEDGVLLNERGERVDFSNGNNAFADDEFAIPLRINLKEDSSVGCCGFRARRENDNLLPIDIADKSTKLNPKTYWEQIRADDSCRVMIKKDEFYIFRSKERFRIPENLAVDCRAYSEGLGDIRIHYAGFAHPLFGRVDLNGQEVKQGAPLIFEVRGFSMNSYLRDGDILAKVYFRRMSALQSKTDGSYSTQELKLSNYFDDWR